MHRIRTSFFIISCVFILKLTTISQTHTDWSYNLGLYEVNVRQYTQAGTFEAFKSHLNRLKELGVGILWFMPIHPIGEENRIGTLGSYYSVKDYYGVNPEFGTMDDFKALVDTAHKMGFYVIIDWVANHTAWDNPLTISHPEWYTKDENGDFMPPEGTDWSDVIDLDYSKQGLRDYMIDAMKFWIEETDIDGFRYDAASMVPLDFWETAIDELKKTKSDILMLAEADGVEYQEAGFDMTFAWGLYGFGSGVFPNIIDGSYNGYNANFLNTYLTQEINYFSEDHYRLYFTSNHDENSWYGTVFERFGNAAEIFNVITLTMNDMPLIYSGQEAGLNKRLAFFEKDRIPWNDHPFFDMYKTLLDLKRENSALWNGSAGSNASRVLTTNNKDVFAFVRQKGLDKIFAVFNLTNSNQVITPTEGLYKDKYVDVFNGNTVTITDSSQIELDAWGYQIFMKNAEITNVNEVNNFKVNFTLNQNYPNPFNPTTTISYSIPYSSYITINVYDVLGNLIQTLVDKKQSAGNYEIQFDGSNLSSGVYFYRLVAGKNIITNRMLLIK